MERDPYDTPFSRTIPIHSIRPRLSRFALPEASIVSLRIYDLIGREIATLAEGMLPAGQHRRIWDAGGSAAGTYFSRLVAVPEGRNAEPFVELRKVILLK